MVPQPPSSRVGGRGSSSLGVRHVVPETNVFGYDVSDLLLTRPPSPPRGNYILNESESHDLNHFLSNLDGTTSQGEGPHAPGLNFTEEWFTEMLPPTYVGHTTHYGQQPPSNLAQTEIQSMNSPSILQSLMQFQPDMMPPPPPQQHQPTPPSHVQHLQPSQLNNQHMFQHMFQPQPQHPGISPYLTEHSSTHTDAAAVLTRMQNSNQGHINQGRPLNSQDSPLGLSFPNYTISAPPNQSLNGIQQTNPSSSSNSQALFRDIEYGMAPSNSRRMPEPAEFKFGSDDQFDGPQGYRRPQHESHEALSRRGVELVRTLQIERDANEGSLDVRNHGQLSPNGLHDHRNGHLEETHETTPPRKRHKSKIKAEDEANNNEVEKAAAAPASNGVTKKRKSKADLTDAAQSASSSSAAIQQKTPKKRRKSTPNVPNPKAPRENLTDAQKRENHIQSEKKRRGAITEGYEGLKFIVPGLKEESSSKSIALQKAGEWVEELKESNRLLQERINALG